jgi:uncharacterized membrane protein
MAKQVISALYDDMGTAQAALNDLVNSGFSRGDISLVAADSTGEHTRRFNAGEYADEDVSGSEGAGFGAVVGALVGLGAMAIPGIGPVIAAGPLAAALIGAGVGAAAGAVTGGITASLVDMGVDTETATYYEEGLRRGGTLVVANTDDDWAERVVSILNRHNPTDLDTKVSEWRASGWSGYGSSTPSATSTSMPSSSSAASTGSVHVFTPPSTVPMADFGAYDPYFRNHFNQTYHPTGYSYDYYLPAYEYGYRLASDNRYRDYDWDRLEASARQNWETHNPNTWDDVKDAIRNAWTRVKEAVS